MDGASNIKGVGGGVVLITLEGDTLEQAITLGFPTSNNKVEYEAILVGLHLAQYLGAKHLIIHSDSQLVVK